MPKYIAALAVFLLLNNFVTAQTFGERNAVILEEFIYQSAPFPSCHAVTLAETTDGTLTAAWFGGYSEGHKRVGIWLSQKIDGRWTPPVEVANGLQEDGDYRATWNPVLFQPENAPLQLHFKTGLTPSGWQGEVMFSKDNGKSWYGRKVLPNNGIGPVRNKPIVLQNGKILCGSSDETGNVWTTHLEITDAKAEHWERTPPLHTPEEAQTIQPTLLQFKDGRILMLCRDRNPNGFIYQCWSPDN
ncbi:MAG: exo-alpha-sialidase, partial [Planctomycetaceae bacterium]|nr:exo-alpha-sialidase [Planctomycetaceae bacterium]